MSNPAEPTVLQIDGFMMRPLQSSDLDALASIWSDPEVTRFLPSQGVPIPTDKAEKSLQSFIEHWQQRGYGVWAIVENKSSQMVGYCGLRYLEPMNEVEVLYGLAKAYWGRGIATQAAKAAVAYGFNIANLDKLIAMALPGNFASRRVIEKAGLQYEKQIHIFNLDVLYYCAKPKPSFPAWYFDESKMAAMLKVKGFFYLRDVIFSFPAADYEISIDEWIKQVAKPEGEGWTAKDFEMHVREEHSTYGWIIEGMLARAGFEIVEANYNSATYAEYLCLKAA